MSTINKLVAMVGLLAIAAVAPTLGGDYGGECKLGRRLRLPPIVAPQHYDIRITPGFDTMTFDGVVSIRVEYLGADSLKCMANNFGDKLKRMALSCFTGEAGQPIRVDRQILINAGDKLTVHHIEVYQLAANSTAPRANLVANFCHDKTNQLLRIDLRSKARPGQEYEIRFVYSGVIGTLNEQGQESQGYYASPHSLPAAAATNTTSKYINTNTHFFPATARSAYPSFDEPDLKATFQLVVVHDKTMKAISNTDIHHRAWNKRALETHFKITGPMSTYNFAFAVGHYEVTLCEQDARIRAWTPLGAAPRAQLVLDTVCKAVGVAEQYFKRPFPLDKLDLVLTKAMRDPSRENWGMLVITEDFFLTDDDTTNVLKVEIVKLATHITLHQWWGDLITAKWWDDQWIFDGFTVWQSHWSTAKMYPEFDYDFNYLLRLQSPMLDAHSTDTVHAIKDYQPRTAEAEIALFDTNTFNKAAAIYQMINSINPAAFEMGLRKLLENNLYSTADASDWFADVGSQLVDLTATDLGSLMRTWLELPGCPLVWAKLTSDGLLEMRQQRFLDYSYVDTISNQTLWKIPLRINVTDLDGGQSGMLFEVLQSRRGQFKLPNWFDASNPRHYIKVNYGFDGFYRTQYSADLLARLKYALEHGHLEPADRFNLLDDYKALFKAGRVGIYEFEHILSLYERERHGGVLSGLAMAMQVLRAGRERIPQVVKTTKYLPEIVYSLFEPTFSRYGFEVIPNEGHANMNGRQDALVQLVAYSHKDVIREALETFDSSDAHLAPFLRKPVYMAVVNFGSDEQFDDLTGRLRATHSNYERSLLIQFLSSVGTNADRNARMSFILKAK